MTAYLLNLADLALSLWVISKGAPELNPLMRSVPVMVFHKTIIIGALCLWLESRPERLARIGLHIVTAAFAAVNIYHIHFIFGGAFT